MRIALVSNWLPPHGRGGAEAYVATLATWLSDHHEVLVLSGSPPVPLGAADVRSLPGLPPIDGATRNKVVWHLRDQWSVGVYRTTLRNLKEFRPDVVAVHSPQGISASVFSAARRVRVPISYTIHDYNALCLRTSFFKNGLMCGGRCTECLAQRAIRGRLIRNASSFIGRSAFVMNKHIEMLGLDTNRTFVNRHGIPEPMPEMYSQRQPPRSVGFLGTLAENKGLLTLLHSWKKAPSGWQLTIAGTGALATRVEKAVLSQPNIEYRGHVNGSDKERFFRDIDVLVVPSEWQEPLPQVALEGLAYGIPVVASRIGGLVELPFALHFDPGNADSLLECVRDALDPSVYADRRHQLSVERFDWSLEKNLLRQEEILHFTAVGPVGGT